LIERMNTLSIRLAKRSDLAAVEMIETRCFHASRRCSRRALRHSILSPAQSVWLAVDAAGGEERPAGAMILHHHRLSLRISSLAVWPSYRDRGLGGRLVRHALDLARRGGRRAVSLEVDRRNRALIDWYARFGFEPRRVLKDYYAPGRDALRMRRPLAPDPKGIPTSVCS